MFDRTIFRKSIGALCLLLLAGCASMSNNPADPWEGFNRKVYAFNDTLDTYALKPVAEGYQNVTPLPARTNIANFFGNIEDVWIGVNNLLQGKGRDGFEDFGRFVINSTVGILGFFDIASEIGLEKHEEDFGQTLGKWGVDSGPYLVLPFFGPRTVRDSGGLVIDTLASPTSHVDSVAVRNSLAGVHAVSDRAQLLGAEKTLDEAALDKYSYVRDFYLQRRKNLIFDGRPPRDEEDDYSALEGLKLSAVGYPASRQFLLLNDEEKQTVK
jgi:phospholipid-binding lipoprotein MlaA